MDQNDEGAVLGAGQLVMDMAVGELDEASRRPRSGLIVQVPALGFKKKRQRNDHRSDHDHTTQGISLESHCHARIVACEKGDRHSLVIVSTP